MCRLALFMVLFNFMAVCLADINSVRELSLDEAILLAVRENPNVQNSQLNHVLQKFALEVQQWQFQPHAANHLPALIERSLRSIRVPSAYDL